MNTPPRANVYGLALIAALTFGLCVLGGLLLVISWTEYVR